MPIKSDPALWTDPRHLRGLAGEATARKYLEDGGWQILAHRFRMGRREVDLIARRGSVIAFVEVKTRRGDRFGGPLQSVGWLKQRELARVARAWVDRHGLSTCSYRFDVIGVTLRPADVIIEHVEDAFRPGWR